jgi:hypothetical protein
VKFDQSRQQVTSNYPLAVSLSSPQYEPECAWMKTSLLSVVYLVLLTLVSSPAVVAAPPELEPWLKATQSWQRDTAGPVLSLGPARSFDDTHIFAPLVCFEKDRYQLWYCGSTGTVAERVFQMGLATSRDGKTFQRHPKNPVYAFGDGKHSVLTPTLLRQADGSLLREKGQLRMWFSSTWFEGGNSVHTLHEATSSDGISWSKPSPALLKHVYAPTIIKTGAEYQLWYTDVSQGDWKIRHARSRDGRQWRVTPDPCLVVDQKWERSRLFYPTVLKKNGLYFMWYGSYWSARANTTALGFAVSLDGLRWTKHPQNPVLRPDPKRPWESHYVTSQTILPVADNAFRIWYASRKQPPFVNKYFALNTALWKP